MNLICGIDEAGRGPLAGPVTAAAVILPNDFKVELLRDSKKLSPKKRLELSDLILKTCFFGIGWASPEEIDELNIHNATLKAMERAYQNLISEYAGDFFIENGIEVIVDGVHIPDIPEKNTRAEIKADDRFPPVMAASILAKTARDLMMERYGRLYPEYEYPKHKGYPTKLHSELLKKWGPPPLQRKSFNIPR